MMNIQMQLGNYRVLRTLGTGGFSTVYLGRHIYLDTLAAIKVLRTDIHLTNQGKEHFLSEARIVARLQHPHIVRILEFGVEQGVAFLIMEYAPNGSLLTRHAARSILPLPDILLYTRQIAEALQFAHDQQIVHCDVKPENLLFNAQDELLLSDFGIAITQHGSSHTHEAVGTMYYMAPEQFKGKPVAASDQYALGVIVYNWLTGYLPFMGKTVQELYHMHTSLAPAKLRALNPAIYPAVEQVVLRALTKDPRQRFASVETFFQAFERACLTRNVSPQAARPTKKIRPAEHVEPQYLLPSLSSLLPSVEAEKQHEDTSQQEPPDLSSGSGHLDPTFVLSPPAQRALQKFLARDTHSLKDPAVSQPPESLPEPLLPPISSPSRAIHWLEGTSHIYSDLTPDERALEAHISPVMSARSSEDETYDAGTKRPPTGKTQAPLVYTQHDAWVSSVAWSPNGRLIASGAWDHFVHIWDARRGKLIHMYEGHTQSVKSVAWSPDGSYLASGGWDNFVHVWEPGTGTTLPNSFRHEAQVETVAWSPDGKYIASAGHDGLVLVWKASNKRLICTYRGHEGPIWSVAWSPDGSTIGSAGHDKTVQLWHSLPGEHLYVCSP